MSWWERIKRYWGSEALRMRQRIDLFREHPSASGFDDTRCKAYVTRPGVSWPFRCIRDAGHTGRPHLNAVGDIWHQEV